MVSGFFGFLNGVGHYFLSYNNNNNNNGITEFCPRDYDDDDSRLTIKSYGSYCCSVTPREPPIYGDSLWSWRHLVATLKLPYKQRPLACISR